MITLIKWNGNKERVSEVLLKTKGKSKKSDKQFLSDEIVKMKKNKEKITIKGKVKEIKKLPKVK